MSSCAVSSKVFRGDHEDLLDHLLVACHSHKLRTEPLPSFGRALEPFFAPGEDLAPLPYKNWQSCGSPPRSSNKGRKGTAATSPGRALPGTHATCRSGKPRVSADLPAVKAPRTRSSFAGSSCGTASSSPVGSTVSSLGTPQQLSSSTSFASAMSSSPPAACPAFFSSPKPEAIPMPTTGLLTASCKPPVMAQRGFTISTAAA